MKKAPIHANCRSVVPPLGRTLKSLKVPKEPPSRSLVRPSDLRAHAIGAPVGMASSVFGFGTVRAKEELIEIRVRLDSGQIEPVFLTAKVLARAVQKMRDARIGWVPAHTRKYAAETRRLLKRKIDQPVGQ